MANAFAVYGHIVYTPSPDKLNIYENHYVVCESSRVKGVYRELPEKYAGMPVYDFAGNIILPGLCDSHIHAPQFAYRGLGMDMHLIDWLSSQTFPEEERYADIEYAETSYSQFAQALRRSMTTRAAVFATVHAPATLMLMRMLEKTGLCCLVGKVNMNRNAPEALLETDAQSALAVTEEWITRSLSEFKRTKPIITPRFVVSCTEKLLSGLGKLARKYDLPVQSHLSENRNEIEWVKKLCPWSDSYADVYEIFDLFGDGIPTVMAHCVHSGDYEREWIKRRGVMIAHCPSSNINLSSGIAPVKQYIDEGMRVGLGTDIAGGFDMSMLRAMSDAIQASKILAYYEPRHDKPLSVSEALYMSTKGASALFGNVGSFEEGCEFDCVVIDDSKLVSPNSFGIKDRLERSIYLERDIKIRAKFARGKRVFGQLSQTQTQTRKHSV